MLKKKALKKIFITSLALFIFLFIYVINIIDKDNKLDSKMEVEYTFNEGTNSIYLINKDGYLVKAKTLITSKDKIKQIEDIINSLIIDNDNSFPDELRGTIPKNTKILEIKYDKELVTLNFSKEFLNLKKDTEEKTIESIVYSIFALKDIKGIYDLLNTTFDLYEGEIECYPYIPKLIEILNNPRVFFAQANPAAYKKYQRMCNEDKPEENKK